MANRGQLTALYQFVDVTGFIPQKLACLTNVVNPLGRVPVFPCGMRPIAQSLPSRIQNCDQSLARIRDTLFLFIDCRVHDLYSIRGPYGSIRTAIAGKRGRAPSARLKMECRIHSQDRLPPMAHPLSHPSVGLLRTVRSLRRFRCASRSNRCFPTRAYGDGLRRKVDAPS